MSAKRFYTERLYPRTRIRVAEASVSLLPIVGIIILVGITFAILRLTLIG